MNTFEIMINHRQLTEFNTADFLKLEERLKEEKPYVFGDFIIQKKIASTQWTASYESLHSKTRRTHLIQIYRVGLIVQQERQQEIDKLRSISHKMMRMDPDFVIKCYGCLQNQDFFILVRELTKKEHHLEQILKECKVKTQKTSVEWIRQITRGLGELYKQHIYPQEFDSSKISLVEDECKINDFNSIGKWSVWKEADLVQKHIVSIASIFLKMVTGSAKLSQKVFPTNQEELKELEEYIKKLTYLSDLARDFLITYLPAMNMKNFTWEKFINHKLFYDETRRGSNDEFLKLAQIYPETPYKQKQMSLMGSSRLSMSKLKTPENENEWDSVQYIEFLKTKIILEKIIHDIADNKIFDMSNREVIEIVYLMTVRCMNNLNEINSEKKKHENSRFITLFCEDIQVLDKKMSDAFQRYSRMLTEKENEKKEIGKDLLKKAKNIITFNFSQNKRRDSFFGGIESIGGHEHDYTKKEQIEFTQQLITKFEMKCKFHYSERDHVFYYLMNYKAIMDLKVEDLGYEMFGHKVRRILEESPSVIMKPQ